jgi:hypothetical protein
MLEQEKPEKSIRPFRIRWRQDFRERASRRRLTVESLEAGAPFVLKPVVFDVAATMDVFVSAQVFLERWAPKFVIVPDAFSRVCFVRGRVGAAGVSQALRAGVEAVRRGVDVEG